MLGVLESTNGHRSTFGHNRRQLWAKFMYFGLIVDICQQETSWFSKADLVSSNYGHLGVIQGFYPTLKQCCRSLQVVNQHFWVKFIPQEVAIKNEFHFWVISYHKRQQQSLIWTVKCIWDNSLSPLGMFSGKILDRCMHLYIDMGMTQQVKFIIFNFGHSLCIIQQLYSQVCSYTCTMVPFGGVAAIETILQNVLIGL